MDSKIILLWPYNKSHVLPGFSSEDVGGTSKGKIHSGNEIQKRQ